MKKVILLLYLLSLSLSLILPNLVFASESLGQISTHGVDSFSVVNRLITAAAYIIGFCYGIGSIIRYKAHRDNPSQVTLSSSIFLVFVSLAFIFMPMLFSIEGKTTFSTTAQTGTATNIS